MLKCPHSEVPRLLNIHQGIFIGLNPYPTVLVFRWRQALQVAVGTALPMMLGTRPRWGINRKEAFECSTAARL